MKIFIAILLILIPLYFFYPSSSGNSTGSVKIGSIAANSENIYVDTDNWFNSSAEFHTYIPSREADDKLAVLIVIGGGVNIKGDYFVRGVWKEFAEKNKFIIIAPSLRSDNEDYAAKRSFHYPSVWSGNAVLEALAQLRERVTIDESNINVFCHSSGAQMGHRFVLQNGNFINRAAIHAPGAVTNASRGIASKLLVTIGSEDRSRRSKIDSFVQSCKGSGISVSFKEYSGVGHMLSQAQIEDSFEFFVE